MEQRLRETDAIIGILLSVPDPNLQRILAYLAQDPFSARTLARVNDSPFGPVGRSWMQDQASTAQGSRQSDSSAQGSRHSDSSVQGSRHPELSILTTGEGSGSSDSSHRFPENAYGVSICRRYRDTF